MSTTEQPHPIWPALVNPHRFAEVRKALAKDPASLLAARGFRWGESAMHWIAMADPGAWIDAVAAGGDPNATDNLGRTPLDWINDRLFMGAMAKHQRLGEPSRDRIRVATIKQVPAVWNVGGRPGKSVHSQPAVRLWLEAGLWDLLGLAVEDPTLWEGWEGGLNALHVWTTLADREGASTVLDRALETGLDINAPDELGRSPLWLAVDAWLTHPAQASAPRAAIEMLRKKGADPDLDAGIGPASMLPLNRGVSDELERVVSQAMEV